MIARYDLVLHPAAQRELDKIPHDIFVKIDKVIQNLRSNPRPFGVKKLEGDLHRVRFGDWRVIYVIFDQERRVVILHVIRRSERTYKNL